MAPSGRITRARTRSSASAEPKARGSTQNKKKLQQQNKKQKNKKQQKEVQKASPSSTITCSSNDFSKNNNINQDHHFDSSSGFSTPKAERYRIPEIMTCPPAPKKQRVVSNCSSLQRTPIAFFAPPDLELFFHFDFHNISV